jgi:hypothetical protein
MQPSKFLMGMVLFVVFTGFFSTELNAQRFKKKKPDKLYARNKKKNVSPIYVGIGTKYPTAQLHTIGTVRMEGLTVNNNLNSIVAVDGSGNLYWRDISNTVANAWFMSGNVITSSHFFGTNNNEDIRIRTNSTQRAIITRTGMVGIGTANPTAQLHTSGTVRFEGLPNNDGPTRILTTDNNGNVAWTSIGAIGGGGASWLLTGNNANATDFLGTTNNEDLRFKTNNIQRGILTTNGFLGIGTASPTAQLHTSGAVRFEGIGSNNSFQRLLTLDNNGNLYYRDAASLQSFFWGITGNSGTNSAIHFIGTTDNNRLVFRVNNTEKMTILPNGYIGVGTNNPGRLLYLQGQAISENAEVVVNQLAGSGLGAYITLNNTANPGGKLWSIGSTGPLNSPTVAGTLEFYQFGFGTRMLLDANGNFGVGIGNGFLPTANFHTKGTVRFESLSNGNGNPLVIDGSGNIFVGTATSGNLWTITGNAGTNPGSNFLGTTDNTRLVFRTNNTEKMTILSNGYTGIGTNNPTRALSINGTVSTDNAEIVVKQMAGSNLGAYITLDNSTNPSGKLWSIGSTGPLNSPTVAGTLEFYQSGFGTRMILDASGNLGVGIGNGFLPTANFHTKGTVRFENLPTGTGNALAIDANGNVVKSSTFVNRAEAEELKKEMEILRNEIENLRSIVKSLSLQTESFNSNEPLLFQNIPNPFDQVTTIRYYLPSGVRSATMDILDIRGEKLVTYNLNGTGNQFVTVNGSQLPAGTYMYRLIVDGRKIEAKKMILTKN